MLEETNNNTNDNSFINSQNPKKIIVENPLLQPRTFLFVSTKKLNVFEKLQDWEKPDSYVLDLEDSVPLNEKSEARKNIKSNLHLFKNIGKKVYIRVNDFGSKDELIKDMSLIDNSLINGVILPKIQHIESVMNLDRWLTEIEKENNISANYFEIIPLIETAKSVELAKEIANASPRVRALSLGLFDLFNDTNAKMNQQNIKFVRNKVMLAGKSAGVSLIDSPFTDIHNYSALFEDCQETINSGYDSKYIIHSDHIDVVNSYFSITKDEKKALEAKLDGFNGGCVINKTGEFIGPPVEKKIRQELKKLTKKQVIPKSPIIPKTFKYGLDLETVHEGQIINCPHEITIDESWTTLWSSLISSSNFIETSETFCKEIGLNKRVLPYAALLNLNLCMAVEPFSESCLLHLGIKNAIYEAPVYSGDTLRCFIYIEKLKNNSDGKRSVIKSKHILVNQDSKRVMSFERMTLFPYIKNLHDKIGRSQQPVSELDKVISKEPSQDIMSKINLPNTKRENSKLHQVNTNDLLIHEASRHLGESENLMFSTLFRNTHPVHFNYLRYDKKEIVVCGGFVMAIVLANANKDLKQVINQEIVSCSHINKIAPLDVISSVSYIHDKEIDGDYEVLTIKTLGLRNIDASTTLSNQQWPKDLFSIEELRPAKMEKLLQQQMPELFHKVCVQVLWKAWRLKA
jgi:citrate lyase beta subunit